MVCIFFQFCFSSIHLSMVVACTRQESTHQSRLDQRALGQGPTVCGSLVEGFIFEDKNTENGEIPTIVNGTMPYWEPSQFAFIRINLAAILEAEFSAATCLISFCCILGIASPSQCIIMVFLETVFYKVRSQLKLEFSEIHFQVKLNELSYRTYLQSKGSN